MSTLASRLAGFLAGFGFGSIAGTTFIRAAIDADAGEQQAAIHQQAARLDALETKAPAPVAAPSSSSSSSSS